MRTLLLGSAFARLIGFVSMPILTRIYTPEDYGILSVFTALVLMLVPFLTLRYMVAIPLPRKDGMAMNVMALSAAVMLSMSISMTLALWAFGPTLLTALSMSVLAPYWWLVVLGVFGTGTYQLLSMWATRRRAYGLIAKTQVYQAGVGASVKIALGLLAYQPFGLLIGQIVAQSGGIGSFLRGFREDFSRCSHMIRLARMLLVARYFRGFPIYRMPSQVFLVFSTQAPLLFTAARYDSETTGLLGLALMAVALPINLLGHSISNAYYAEVAKLSKKAPQDILELTKSVQKRLFVFGSPAALVVIMFGDDLFGVAFGAQWREAGSYASTLAVFLLLQLTSAPLIQVLTVFDKNRMFLGINIARAALLATLFCAAYIGNFDISAFVLSYSGLMALFYLSISYTIIRFLITQTGLARPLRHQT